jgi:D-alanine transaminase
MSRIAYVSGRYVPHRFARVHIEDRGYQFADGVYEVVALQNGTLVDEEPHLDRLDRSLSELRIAPPMPRRALRMVMREVIRRNALTSGSVYVQVTRGVAPRDHAFPATVQTQTVITVKRPRPVNPEAVAEGVKVITLPDLRWERCDIKSIGLLPNVLAKQAAREAGAYEAWLVDSRGMVTEGSSTNAWIVSPSGELITHQAGHQILNGVTRRAVLHIARELDMPLVERPFSLTEAKAAREAFLTSTSVGVLPITQIDEQVIANGKPGMIASRLSTLYAQHAAS